MNDQKDEKEILKETREIDNWKCPYCHEVVYDTPKAMEDSAFNIMDTFYEECPHCGKTSKIFISPEYIAQPLEEDIADEDVNEQVDFYGEFSIVMKIGFSTQGLFKEQVKEKIMNTIQLGDIELTDMHGRKVCDIEEIEWAMLDKTGQGNVKEPSCLCDFEVEEG